MQPSMQITAEDSGDGSASKSPAPRLLTFDVFGTVLDWRRGLSEALASAGRALVEGEFDRIVDRQGELEREKSFRSYREVTRQSLIDVLAVAPAAADAIGARVGHWPVYEEAEEALRALMSITPCVAMTNSDRVHGDQAQAGLGFPLSGWFCAETLRLYKPDPQFFKQVAQRLGLELGPTWWHVSAYADYDLRVANELGLTTVLVERPHSRPGPATHRVTDLRALLALVKGG